MGLEVLELLVQRRMRFVLPVLRWRWRVGRRFWYLPFSRNLCSDWFGYKLSQTEFEQFATRQPYGYWTGLLRHKLWGLEFQAMVSCPSGFHSAIASQFAARLEKNLGAGWRVKQVVLVNGDSRTVLFEA